MELAKHKTMCPRCGGKGKAPVYNWNAKSNLFKVAMFKLLKWVIRIEIRELIDPKPMSVEQTCSVCSGTGELEIDN